MCGKGFIKSSGLTQHMRRHTRLLSKINENVKKSNDEQNDLLVEYMEKDVADNNKKQKDVIICYGESSESLTEYLDS